jgi:hypothetical protein
LTVLKVAVALSIFAGLCPASDRAGCSGGQSCVTEVLSGVVDGKNNRFSISHTPDSNAPVQVYRNGVPLDSGDDYEVSGSTITFANREHLQPGDVLQVMYKPASRELQPTRSVSRRLGTAGGGEISTALARLALSSELSRLSERELNAEPADLNSPPPTEADHLLARHSATASHKGSTQRSQNSKTYISAQGVDGLGDNALSAPTELDTSDPLSHDASSSAIQLLQRRLKTQRSSADSDDTSSTYK